MKEFKSFLLIEQNEFLAQKIGDILGSLHSLASDSGNLDSRQLLRGSEKLLNCQIRPILSGRWSPQQTVYLKDLQRAAYALAVAIDKNENIKDVLVAVKTEIENLQKKIGEPINKLAVAPTKISSV